MIARLHEHTTVTTVEDAPRLYVADRIDIETFERAVGRLVQEPHIAQAVVLKHSNEEMVFGMETAGERR